MCEYCGCQDIPAIAALTTEHDEIRAVAREAAGAVAANQRLAAGQAAGRLLALLSPHTEIEERGLFPAMAAEFTDHVASLESDHRQIEDALARAAGGEHAGWAEDLSATLSDLFNHILREQDGLFPAALSVLTPGQWEILDEIRAQVSQDQRSSAR